MNAGVRQRSADCSCFPPFSEDSIADQEAGRGACGKIERTGFRVFPCSVVIQEGRGDRFRRAVFTSEEHRAALLKMSFKVGVSGKGQ